MHQMHRYSGKAGSEPSVHRDVAIRQGNSRIIQTDRGNSTLLSFAVYSSIAVNRSRRRAISRKISGPKFNSAVPRDT